MFKIVAVVFIGILAGIGFFDRGQEAYTLAALLFGIGALLDYAGSEQRTEGGIGCRNGPCSERAIDVAVLTTLSRPQASGGEGQRAVLSGSSDVLAGGSAFLFREAESDLGRGGANVRAPLVER
jgi:hypothetical protein